MLRIPREIPTIVRRGKSFLFVLSNIWFPCPNSNPCLNPPWNAANQNSHSNRLDAPTAVDFRVIRSTLFRASKDMIQQRGYGVNAPSSRESKKIPPGRRQAGRMTRLLGASGRVVAGEASKALEGPWWIRQESNLHSSSYELAASPISYGSKFFGFQKEKMVGLLGFEPRISPLSAEGFTIKL